MSNLRLKERTRKVNGTYIFVPILHEYMSAWFSFHEACLVKKEVEFCYLAKFGEDLEGVSRR